MSHHDVFNGDADGICALHQLRLAAPRESRLVTGAKRDIELLARVVAQPGDSVTVLDVSLDRNRAGLLRLTSYLLCPLVVTTLTVRSCAPANNVK